MPATVLDEQIPKYCGGCDRTKLASEYWKNSRSPDGLQYQCKDCMKARYFTAEGKLSRWEQNIEKKYGISAAAYRALFDSQAGRCAVCRKLPGKKRLSVDHCHATGLVRGLLCGNCNFSIGYAKDDPEILRGLADYLERH